LLWTPLPNSSTLLLLKIFNLLNSWIPWEHCYQEHPSIKYEIPSGSLNLVLLETHRPNTLDKKNPLLFPWSLMLHQLQNFAPSNSLNTTFLVEFSILTITFKLREVFLLVGEKKRVMREYMKNMWKSIRWYIWCAKNRVSLDSFSMKKTLHEYIHRTSWFES
jgi:hypothetical protein